MQSPNEAGSGQELELLVCLPTQSTSQDKPPILFIHGAFCSAHDFQFFLPYFASRGYPSYALSLRGHGKSWTPNFLELNLMTTMGDHISDIKAILQFIRDQQGSSAQRPIVCAHSFGGGYVQHLLSQETKSRGGAGPRLLGGLVLLGSAPIWGGAKQIMSHWERIETDGKGYAWPWSPRSQLDTAKQVRDAFFRDGTEEHVIQLWRDTCRTKVEGLRTGLAAFWPFGTAGEVLAAIEGFGQKEGLRKVLCVAAERDRLVTVDMVSQNTETYVKKAADGAQVVTQRLIPDCGHHLMMDTPWKQCADEIIRWIEM
ncbi:Alpha/Beta hydrolase protein [Coniochaeta sp. 2T2.1]|nr:Alpha/Beta hydrolase protein [Coniochaeta sp. 2T2.1]